MFIVNFNGSINFLWNYTYPLTDSEVNGVNVTEIVVHCFGFSSTERGETKKESLSLSIRKSYTTEIVPSLTIVRLWLLVDPFGAFSNKGF